MWITDRDFYTFIGVLLFIGFACGFAVLEGVPWLWAFVKPWLHAATA